MKSHYKRLGNYIQEINIRNVELKVNNLLGININKFFMPSVANIVGTDMTTYKIVKNGQFACNRMHVGRDKRLPVALLNQEEPIIVSPAYNVFEIINTDILLPEYLMMWFSRAEFDRNAWFYTDADVRGGLNWNDFCNMVLPVPSIEKQKEIVKEYHVIVDRINLNNRLIQKLEETAQAIYKQWFVDFEFPDENGKPYKSNGGEMEFNKELEKEIPKGWEALPISSFCEITSSKRIFESEYKKDGVAFYRGGEISLKKEGKAIKDMLYISKERYNEIVKAFGKITSGDILMTAVGTLGVSYLVQDEEFYFKDGNVIWFKKFNTSYGNYFLYDFFQSKDFNSLLSEITIGSTQNAITITTLGQQKIITPVVDILNKYGKISCCLNKNIAFRKDINLKMYYLNNILLSKLATVTN